MRLIPTINAMRIRLPLIFILLIASAALLSVLLLPAFLAEKNGGPGASPEKPPKAAWISIDFGDGTRRTFECPMEKESYPFPTVLEDIIKDAEIPIQIEKGAVVSRIPADHAGRWRVYRNGAAATGALETLTIASGDRYELRFEK